MLTEDNPNNNTKSQKSGHQKPEPQLPDEAARWDIFLRDTISCFNFQPLWQQIYRTPPSLSYVYINYPSNDQKSSTDSETSMPKPSPYPFF